MLNGIPDALRRPPSLVTRHNITSTPKVYLSIFLHHILIPLNVNSNSLLNQRRNYMAEIIGGVGSILLFIGIVYLVIVGILLPHYVRQIRNDACGPAGQENYYAAGV